jgi:hypothetical protein
MAKCIKCGVNFVGTPENPPIDGVCKWCLITEMALSIKEIRDACDDQREAIDEILANHGLHGLKI